MKLLDRLRRNGHGAALQERPIGPTQDDLRRAFAAGHRKGSIQVIRSYAAAQSDRLTSQWTQTPVPIDAVLMRELRPLRARSRDAAQNDPYARRFLGMVRSNVIGRAGIGFQARVKDPPPAETQDDLANGALEDGWKDFWGRKENCDMRAMMAGVSLATLFVSTVAKDGEALVHLPTGPDVGPHGIGVQLLDPELLPVEYNAELEGGHYIRMGVECNGWGRPIAYHVQEPQPNSHLYQLYGYSAHGRKYRRIPATEMLHCFLPEEVGQTRGIPWMATGLLRMRMEAGLEDAGLTAARAGAMKVGFYTATEGDEEYQGDDKDDAGNTIEDLEPGTARKLPKGVTFNSWDPTYPHGEFPGFVKTILRGVASGLNVSYNILANDLEGVNFSSIRTGVLEDRAIWMALQEWVIDAFMRPIYERWLKVQLFRGSLTVPSTSGAPRPLNPDREEKYRQVSWQPRRWSWVDPLKEMAANEKAFGLSISTIFQLIREQGLDPEEVLREKAREKKFFAELGIEYPVVGKQQPSAPSPADDEDGLKDLVFSAVREALAAGGRG